MADTGECDIRLISNLVAYFLHNGSMFTLNVEVTSWGTVEVNVSECTTPYGRIHNNDSSELGRGLEPVVKHHITEYIKSVAKVGNLERLSPQFKAFALRMLETQLKG